MNLEKVIFGFFILLAATLNFGFVYGDLSNPEFHNRWEFFAALVVNLIATVLKFGDRTHVGAIHLAASMVALIQLVAAAIVWFFAPVGARRHGVGARHGGYRLAGRRRIARQCGVGDHPHHRNHHAETLT
jgi:hypothetical protein